MLIQLLVQLIFASFCRVFVNSSGEPDYFVESADTMIILTDLVHGSFYKVSLATQSTIVFRQLDIINYHNQPTIEFYTGTIMFCNHFYRSDAVRKNRRWSESGGIVAVNVKNCLGFALFVAVL